MNTLMLKWVDLLWLIKVAKSVFFFICKLLLFVFQLCAQSFDFHIMLSIYSVMLMHQIFHIHSKFMHARVYLLAESEESWSS
jgi:hypothetical protein